MSKKFKKNTWVALAIAAAVLLTGLGVYATRSKAMTLKEARALAQKELPQSAEYVGGTESENKFRTLFYDKENNGKYKVEVSKKTGKVKKIEAEMYGGGAFGGSRVSGREDVEKIIREKFKGIQSIYIESGTDDGRPEYEAEFKGDGFYGEAQVDPETGAILNFTLKFGAAVIVPKSGGRSSGKDMLTKEQAVKAALEASGGGVVEDFDIETGHGKYYYEVDIIKGNREIEYFIDPETGEATVENECEKFFGGRREKSVQKAGKDTYISADTAKNIVLKRIPGAYIHEFEPDREHGRDIYEGEAVLDGYVYEFEIDAASGIIMKWEKELIKYDSRDDDDDNGDDDDYDDDDDDDGDGDDE